MRASETMGVDVVGRPGLVSTTKMSVSLAKGLRATAWTMRPTA